MPHSVFSHIKLLLTNENVVNKIYLVRNLESVEVFEFICNNKETDKEQSESVLCEESCLMSTEVDEDVT